MNAGSMRLRLSEGCRAVCSKCGWEGSTTQHGGCSSCGGPLEFQYAPSRLRSLEGIQPGRGLVRYAPVLPVDKACLPYLGEGDTPVLFSRRLSRRMGLSCLMLKNEALNPTGSFKDRGICVSLAAARESGARGVMTVSSGNAAASLVTYAASAGMDCMVLVDSGAPLEKIAQIRFMGGHCILVDDLFEKGPEVLLDFIRGLCDGLGFWCAFSFASINPYSQEGTKTIAYECAVLDPDVVVCPVAGGDNLGGQWKGYKELHEAGLLDKRPRMVGVQLEGAAPLVQSFAGGKRVVETLKKAHSGLTSLRTTFSGGHALSAIYESEGYALEVTDTMCRVDRERLAREEGVWVEGASASVIAAIPLLLSKGVISSSDRVLCIMTGSGYKEPLGLVDSRDLLHADMDSKEVIEKYMSIKK